MGIKGYSLGWGLLFVLCCADLHAQKGNFADISAFRAAITVFGADSGYSTVVEVTGTTGSENICFPVFYDEKLQHITGVRLYYRSGNRYRLCRDPQITDDPVNINFHSSKRMKVLKLEPNTGYKITYNDYCPELMYFSGLSLFSFHKTDTSFFSMDIPRGYHLLFDIIYPDSLGYLSVDTLRGEDHTVYTIKTTPLKIKSDPLVAIGVYRNLRLPFMRAITVPDSYKGRESVYYNNWHLGHTRELVIPDSATRSAIDSITAGIEGEEAITDTLYNFIRKNFKYVDVEVGMGAFIPHDVNSTFRNRHGDCKDLSNLLGAALRYKGIDARVALASAFNHISDTDFPSLSSSNHEICVVYRNNLPVLLDPTDALHNPGQPVQSLQGRTIFVIGENGGEYLHIDPLNPEENHTDCNIDLKLTDNTLAGKFRIERNGFSGYYLRNLVMTSTKKDFDNSITEYLESIFGNQTVKNLRTIAGDDKMIITGELVVKGKYYLDSQSSGYLFIDFIPGLFDLDSRTYKIKEETYIGATIDKNISLTVDLGASIGKFAYSGVSMQDNNYTFNISADKLSESVLKVRYDFRYNSVWINREHMNRVNQLIETYLQKTNEPLIIH